MISCNPISLFSWNFRLAGDMPEEVATIEFRWLSEQGTITTSVARYEVIKLGMFSGEWHLKKDWAVYATAKKTSLFTRQFAIAFDNQSAVLEAPSAFSRTMHLTTQHGGGSIAPRHPFTNRATIEMVGVPFHIQCFAFWLTALTWKRQSNNS